MITKSYNETGVLFTTYVELNSAATSAKGLKKLINELRSIANVLEETEEEFKFKEKSDGP